MKKIRLTISLLILSILCRAQATTGSDLVSVDPFTGVGNLTIPIKKIVVDDILDLSVSLSYNCKGVTVDEASSSVGLGWNLNAGGSITREARSFEDEASLPGSFLAGYNDMRDTLQGILVPSLHLPNNPSDPAYDDQEPDVFSLNLGYKNYKFAFKYNSPTPVYITSPTSGIKIELFTKDFVNGSYTNSRTGVHKHIGKDSMKNILSFVVTDEQGNKFFFERGDYERKKYGLKRPNNVIDSIMYYSTSKWNLVKIITLTGKVVTYEYVSKYVENIVDVQEKFKRFSAFTYPVTVDKIIWRGWKSHISKINLPNKANIEFTLDTNRCDCPGNFRLQNIKITSRGNTMQYRLNQAYYNSPLSYINVTELPLPANCSFLGAGLWNFPVFYTTPQKNALIDSQMRYGIRLKLKSIDRIGLDNVSSESFFTFDYNTMSLPHRFSATKDYYGYYNGKSTTQLQVWDPNTNTTHTYYLSIPYHVAEGFGLNRKHDFTYAQAGVLNKITNGTGGVTTITYQDYQLENHSCSFGNLSTYPWSYNSFGCTTDTSYLEGKDVNDGLIIGSIKTSDFFHKEGGTTTEYTFKKGKRFFAGGYTSYKEGTHIILTNDFTNSPDFFNGNNHGFDTTIITVKGYNNEWLSKQKLTFSNLIYKNGSGGDESCLRLPTNRANYECFNFMPADFKKFRLGILLRKDVYNEHDKLNSTQINTFKIRPSAIEVTASKYPVGPQPPTNPEFDNFGLPRWQFHIIDYETALQDSSTLTSYEYASTGNIAATHSMSTRYRYDDKNNLRCIETEDSKGGVVRKYYGYNYHYVNLGYSGTPPVVTMTNLGLQHLVSEENWKIIPGDSLLLSYSINAPDYYAGDNTITFPNIYVTTLTEPLASSLAYNETYINRKKALNFLTSIGTGTSFKHVSSVTLYDDKKNALEAKVPGWNIYSSKIWDKERGELIAEVKNASHEEIAHTSFEEDATDLLPSGEVNRGNWIFDPVATVTKPSALSKVLTGKYIHELAPGQNVVKSGKLMDRTYLLTYWIYTPSTSSIFSLVVTDDAQNSTALSPVLRKTVGQWKLYSVVFTPPSPATDHYIEMANLAGGSSTSSVYLDELRLHPLDAEMITTTYKPLLGVGTVCDADNRVTYFEYDVHGRLRHEKDMYGNVIRKIEQVNKAAAVNPTPVSQVTY